MQKIAVVILNYKNYALTSDTISSLVKSEFHDSTTLEFYIVDNHSENGSLEKIEASVSQRSLDKEYAFHFIQSPVNEGYAKGINLGIRRAVADGCEYVATVNPDITVKTDSMDELYRGLKESEYAMLGPKIYDTEGNIDRTCARREPTLAGYFFRMGLYQKIFPDNRFINEHYIDIDDINSGIVDVDVVSGAFMLYKSAALIAIDFFDENTFLYNEEFIIHARLKKLRYKTGVNTRSIVYHSRGASSHNVKTSMFLVNAETDSLEYYLQEYKSYSSLLCKSILTNKQAPIFLRSQFSRS